MAYRILSGTQFPPHRLTGSDGDYYVNTVRWHLFGPKSRGAWPQSVPIWPDGVPRPAPDVSNDRPLLAGAGTGLATDRGSVLSGDVPVRP